MANKKRLDLIDRGALGIGKAKREAFNNPSYADGWNSAISIIENAPTVDAEEVVRCKNCRKISPSVTPIKNAVWCREFRAYMPCDGFCSYGERKDND